VENHLNHVFFCDAQNVIVRQWMFDWSKTYRNYKNNIDLALKGALEFSIKFLNCIYTAQIKFKAIWLERQPALL